jgi:hypothetical protein
VCWAVAFVWGFGVGGRHLPTALMVPKDNQKVSGIPPGAPPLMLSQSCWAPLAEAGCTGPNGL